jgi:transposase
MGWANRGHQVCLAHLIRDVQYAIDAGDSVLRKRAERMIVMI